MSATSRGMVQAVAAYLIWGLLPVYWKALRGVPAPEILAHRIVWSLAFLGVIVLIRPEWAAVKGILENRRARLLYGVAACLLAVNWLTYIHGVNTDRIVETSLGYFINPLVSVLLGVVFLGERLRRGQWMAVMLAAIGVAYLTVWVGRLPWIALVLAVSFGLYGLAKKKAPAGAVPGLIVETGVLFLPAAVGLVVMESWGTGVFGHGTGATRLLLVLGGLVTAVPLLLFASAARAVPLTTLGLLQYLAPTCGLLIGVWGYGEGFDRGRQIGFGLIWSGLGVYWLEGIWRGRRWSTRA
ncbi:MAG: EamA family transporter RarD [Limisphaerales bacterium]